MDEQECIRRCQSGDWSAFVPIFRSHIQMAVRTAYLITRDWAAAEDAAQEALIRAYRAIGSFRSGSALAPWLYRIVVNEARRLAGRPGAVPVSPETLAELIPAADDRAPVWDAVGALDEEHRTVLVLKYFRGFTEAEIATGHGETDRALAGHGPIKLRGACTMNSLRLIGITAVVLALAGLTGCSAPQHPARPVIAQAVAPTPAPAVIETFRGVPLPPAAQHTQDVWLDVHIYRIDGTTWEQVRDWYLDQMPRYGWNTLKCGGQPVPVEYHSVFGTGTGGRAAIGLRAQPQYTELMIQTEVMAGVAGATCEGPR